jgi:hypothetical protein
MPGMNEENIQEFVLDLIAYAQIKFIDDNKISAQSKIVPYGIADGLMLFGGRQLVLGALNIVQFQGLGLGDMTSQAGETLGKFLADVISTTGTLWVVRSVGGYKRQNFMTDFIEVAASTGLSNTYHEIVNNMKIPATSNVGN